MRVGSSMLWRSGRMVGRDPGGSEVGSHQKIHSVTWWVSGGRRYKTRGGILEEPSSGSEPGFGKTLFAVASEVNVRNTRGRLG